MFSIKNLDTKGHLEAVWKAAYDVNNNNDDEECNLPEICRSIDTWICNDDYEIDRRLSLRTSATLISGAAKLYKTGLCKLFEDIKMLDENMLHRKRRFNNNLRSSSSYDFSEYAATPEQVRHQMEQNFAYLDKTTTMPSDIKMGYHVGRFHGCGLRQKAHLDTSYSARKKTKANTDYAASNSSNGLPSRSSVDNTCANIENCSNNESRLESFSNNFNDNSSEQVEDAVIIQELETSTGNKTRDQEVQTSPAVYRTEEDHNSLEDDLDRNLPFGYILIHDNYHSRIPSKIILTSITSDVKNLI